MILAHTNGTTVNHMLILMHIVDVLSCFDFNWMLSQDDVYWIERICMPRVD